MADLGEGNYKRDHPREAVRTKAKVMADGKWHDCVITNISPTGARLYLRLVMLPEKEVRVQIDEFGQFNATIIWCDGGETGVRFEHHPSEMANVLLALAPKGDLFPFD